MKEWETFTCIPKGNGKVVLKSYHNRFLCAESSGNAVCNREKALGWETHTVVQQGGRIGLRSCHNKYLSAQSNHSLQWNRDVLNAWELFTVTVHEILPDDLDLSKRCKISLRSHHGRFMCAESNGQITCNREKALGWETFTCVPMGNGKVALQSCHGKFLCAESSGRAVCDRSQAQGWEIHTVVQQGGKIGLRSCHNKYLSAQSNHSLQWNRDVLNAWELFTVIVHETEVIQHKDAVCWIIHILKWFCGGVLV